MAADLDVVEDRHLVEQRHVLERASDTDLGDGVPGPVEDGLALEQHIAAVGRVEPAQAIEEGRLAGAVRADQAGDLAGEDIEGHAVEGNDAAEAGPIRRAR